MAEYIKREAAIKAIDNEVSFDGLYANIKAIPAADVRPERHGHWEEHEEIYAQCLNFCSECNKGQVRGSKTPFCPFCGAKMDGKGTE